MKISLFLLAIFSMNLFWSQKDTTIIYKIESNSILEDIFPSSNSINYSDYHVDVLLNVSGFSTIGDSSQKKILLIKSNPFFKCKLIVFQNEKVISVSEFGFINYDNIEICYSTKMSTCHLDYNELIDVDYLKLKDDYQSSISVSEDELIFIGYKDIYNLRIVKSSFSEIKNNDLFFRLLKYINSNCW